jgi:hypothetical protein
MINAFWSALQSRLAAGTALTALLGGTANPRIYHNKAPDGTPMPFVVYQWQGGGFNHDTPHNNAEGVVTVQAYSKVNEVEAGSISEQVFALLDRQPLTVSGWANPMLFAEQPHLQADLVSKTGAYTYSCGDMYRIMLDYS